MLLKIWSRIIFRKIFEKDDPEVIERAEKRMDEFMESQVKAAVEKGGSAVYGGLGDPGSSSRGGL